MLTPSNTRAGFSTQAPGCSCAVRLSPTGRCASFTPTATSATAQPAQAMNMRRMIFVLPQLPGLDWIEGSQCQTRTDDSIVAWRTVADGFFGISARGDP